MPSQDISKTAEAGIWGKITVAIARKDEPKFCAPTAQQRGNVR
jgi:hypothetical protein